MTSRELPVGARQQVSSQGLITSTPRKEPPKGLVDCAGFMRPLQRFRVSALAGTRVVPQRLFIAFVSFCRDRGDVFLRAVPADNALQTLAVDAPLLGPSTGRLWDIIH